MYNGVEYYYVKNLQGDIIGLIDASGAWVVEYRYDAWVRLLAVTGTLASTLGQENPFPYRGYYYDAETGLYYVSSRYYSPEICRFISPDKQLNLDIGFGGSNLYVYCFNNPIIYNDYDGKRPILSTSTSNETREERKASFAYMNDSVLYSKSSGHENDRPYTGEPAYMVGIGMVLTGILGIGYILGNNVTGVGITDDFLLAPLGTSVKNGIILIFNG